MCVCVTICLNAQVPFKEQIDNKKSKSHIRNAERSAKQEAAFTLKTPNQHKGRKTGAMDTCAEAWTLPRGDTARAPIWKRQVTGPGARTGEPACGLQTAATRLHLEQQPLSSGKANCCFVTYVPRHSLPVGGKGGSGRPEGA